MNRRHNNILAILVTLAMLLMAMPMTASAATAPDLTAADAALTEGTLTIDKSRSTFSIYKLASASVVENSKAYTYTSEAAFTGFFVDNSGTGGENYTLTDGGIGKITGFTTGSQQLATDLEDYIAANTVSATLTGVSGGDDTTTPKTSPDETTLGIGYYLIVETGTNSAEATVASKAMLVSIPTADYTTTPSSWDFDVTATLKQSEGSIEKKIVEGASLVDANTGAIINASSTTPSSYYIPYKITATVPDYDDSVLRSDITYIIADTLSAGLDYVDGSLAVTYYGTDPATVLTLGTDYTMAHTADASANATEPITLTFDFAKLEKIIEDAGGVREIVVTFDATLNANADQTTAGNPNDVSLTYTSNPTTHTTYSTTDRVITYTTGIAVEKYSMIDNVKTDLAGAQFTLRDSEGNAIATYKYDANGNPITVTGTAETDGTGMIYFPGLGADGGAGTTYYLTEDVAPAGYHLLESPVEITLTAVTDSTSGLPTGAFTCTTNFGDVNPELVKPTTVTTETTNKMFFEVRIENGVGWTLPGTGGSGTMMFTIGGIALIVLSGVVLLIVLKRRSSKTK